MCVTSERVSIKISEVMKNWNVILTSSFHPLLVLVHKNKMRWLKKGQENYNSKKTVRKKKKRGEKPHLKTIQMCICCILSHYLFISVSCLNVALTLKPYAALNWNQICGRPGGAGCFFWDLKERLDKGGDFTVFGVLRGKISGLKVDWQWTRFRVAVGWTNAGKKIFSEAKCGIGQVQ